MPFWRRRVSFGSTCLHGPRRTQPDNSQRKPRHSANISACSILRPERPFTPPTVRGRLRCGRAQRCSPRCVIPPLTRLPGGDGRCNDEPRQSGSEPRGAPHSDPPPSDENRAQGDVADAEQPPERATCARERRGHAHHAQPDNNPHYVVNGPGSRLLGVHIGGCVVAAISTAADLGSDWTTDHNGGY